MPLLEFHIPSGLSDTSKRKLLQKIIEVVHETIDDDPKLVNVILHDHSPLDLMVSGRVYGDHQEVPESIA